MMRGTGKIFGQVSVTLAAAIGLFFGIGHSAAQPTEPAAAEVQPLSGTKEAQGLSKTAYEAVLANVRSDTIASLLRDAVRSSSEECPYVTDYQIFKEGTGYRTLKVKCKERQLFMVTLRSQGTLTIVGGDGSVGPMLPRDGYITSLTGQRIDDYLSDQAREDKVGPSQLPTKAAAGPTPATATQSGGLATGWIVAIVLFNLLVLGVLLMALDRFFRPSRDVFEALTQRLANVRSAGKDELIEESREVYTDIFAHPDGYFIARGSHGKRRFFPTLIAAILYRNYGIKIREIKTS
jgi:hypothetical protein